MGFNGRNIAIILIIGIVVVAAGVWYYMDASSRVDEMSVRIYADPAAENILASIESGDLASFTRDMDAAMKAAYTEAQFNEIQDTLHGKVGSYGGKTFTKAERSGEYIVAYYKAVYSNEPAGVTVRVVFTVNTGGPAQVSGLWFSSPKLAS
jgi:hypothetical protein